MGKSGKKQTPQRYFNRELSWLEFNDRVLREGLRPELPLLERLKFLSIVSSNLDEAFMIRVAGLMQQRAAGLRRRGPAGMTPSQQLIAFSKRAHRMVDEQATAIRDVLTELAGQGLKVCEPADWTSSQQKSLRNYFAKEILPVLTPMAVEDLDPCPLLPGLRLCVAGVLAPRETNGEEKNASKEPETEKVVAVPVPGSFARFAPLHAEEGVNLVRLEDIIAANLGMLFPGREVLATAVFRVTRDADVEIQDLEAGDLLQTVEEAVLDRRRRAAVRLEISANPHPRIHRWLVEWLGLQEADVYEIDGMLDARALFEIADWPGFESLKIPEWPPQPPEDLIGRDDLWQAIQEDDVLLIHPYESFEPVVQLIELAAADPAVVSIKQTLYRTSGDSPIIRALARAAENGKEVTALVELKARFDEARNIVWARRLEDAGCHVVYGVAGLKTHAKALLIVRREPRGLRRYVHLATGNYNDKTARLYSDIGLMTCDREIASDVAAFFNLLTGHSEMVGWSKLAVAPTGLRRRLLEMIDREIQISTGGGPGLIMAKMNSLQDPEICEALYEASKAGVNVKLNIRGICCLRPGVKGLSENIDVVSIIDRYLEHARVFYFRNGGHEEVYLSSADWMVRNLSKRLELMFPVTSPRLRRRLIQFLRICFADNVQSHRLRRDGAYERISNRRRNVRAQETFYNEAVEAAHAAEKTTLQFRPLTRPEE
ncbi:MAG: polyphosphate kinase 1 [Pirellulales bacterium]|nr:polyphosphate kinase 1 [Pirellulales bacterium]